MLIKSLLSATIATLILTAGFTQGVNAQSKTVSSDGTTIGTDGDTWFLRTPNSDTTKAFDGGRLRIYDVHIAKMVEITHYQCNNTRSSQDRTWFYSANDTNMGRFQISCKLAQDLATAYGMGRGEPTAIFMAEIEEPSTIRIPTLNIKGEKVEAWMRFTQNFKPVR